MNLRKSLILAMCGVLPAGAATSASAESLVSGAVITAINVTKSYGEILFIKVDKPKSTPPGCDTNGFWTYVLPLTTELDKKLYAMLLTARATGAPVTLTGTGTCSAFGTIESLNSAQM
jgi:hypothetical protein